MTRPLYDLHSSNLDTDFRECRIWLDPEKCLDEAERVARAMIEKDPLAFVCEQHNAYFGMPDEFKKERVAERGEAGVTQRFRATWHDITRGTDSYNGRTQPCLWVSTGLEAQVIRMVWVHKTIEENGVTLEAKGLAVKELAPWRPFKPEKLPVTILSDRVLADVEDAP